MEGYIKIFRKKLEWRWFRDPSVAHLFEYLTLRANYSDKEWQDRIIKRGQLISSREKLSEETGLSVKIVRRCLNALKRTGEISIVTTNQYTLITITKYSEYQGEMGEEGLRKACVGPAIAQQRATKKEYKKDEKRIDTSLRSGSSSSATTCESDEMNFLAFMDFFNCTIQENGAQIPTITVMTPQRRQAVGARVREYGKDALRRAVINAATAPFLNGAGDKAWVADFNWIFKPLNFVKVLEGNYNRIIKSNINSNGRQNINSNSGRRTAEDIYGGAARAIASLEQEAQQLNEDLPVV
jgi:DNA-binding transcriptional regulator YhcF (GntR family)